MLAIDIKPRNLAGPPLLLQSRAASIGATPLSNCLIEDRQDEGGAAFIACLVNHCQDNPGRLPSSHRPQRFQPPPNCVTPSFLYQERLYSDVSRVISAICHLSLSSAVVSCLSHLQNKPLPRMVNCGSLTHVHVEAHNSIDPGIQLWIHKV
jgi:hypothetical protein